MKAKLEKHNGIDYLTFKITEGIGWMHLPVITKGSREGTNFGIWNGDLEKPTLTPSIRIVYHNGIRHTEIHYKLTDGVAECLDDCTDGNAGKKLTLLDIT